MGRLGQLDGTRVLRAFVRMGWRVVRSKGSHHIIESPDGVRVSIPVHKGKALKEGTLRSILKQAAVAEETLLANY